MPSRTRGLKKKKEVPATKSDDDGVELTHDADSKLAADVAQETGVPTAPSTIVVDANPGKAADEAAHAKSAEFDEAGRPYLADQAWQKMGGAGEPDPGWLDRLFTNLYGNLPREDRFRVAWLAGTLFFIIGGYWLLRCLKDPIVKSIVGVENIPRCKMLSLVVVFCLVFVYNKMVDVFPKHQLFYIIGGFYFAVFAAISFLLADPEIGISNTNASPYRLIGWVSYCAIESFGSIVVSLFWAFVNSSINVEGAKSAYGLIIAGGNMGSILGPTVVNVNASVGVHILYGIGSMCMGLMVIMVWAYVRMFGVDPALMKSKQKKKGASVLEGFKLFLQYDYIKGIFAMSCLFMVEVTILDFTMKQLAAQKFDSLYPGDEPAATEAFVSFMALFGQVTNVISFSFSLLGTSMVIRRLGLKLTLLAFPILCLAVVLMVMLVPDLYVVFLALILLKGFSYSLNNPCKEILYQPTNAAVKFKSKSWIDIFGARMSKAGGSVVTDAFRENIPGLINFGGTVAAGVAGFLIWVAWKMGRMFDDLMEDGDIVGGSPEVPKTLEALAAEEVSDDEAADTSCGVLEEGQGGEEAFSSRDSGVSREQGRTSDGTESKSQSSIDL